MNSKKNNNNLFVVFGNPYDLSGVHKRANSASNALTSSRPDFDPSKSSLFNVQGVAISKNLVKEEKIYTDKK